MVAAIDRLDLRRKVQRVARLLFRLFREQARAIGVVPVFYDRLLRFGQRSARLRERLRRVFFDVLLVGLREQMARIAQDRRL